MLLSSELKMTSSSANALLGAMHAITDQILYSHDALDFGAIGLTSANDRVLD